MKYLDKDGLQQYDGLIKQFINNHVPDLAQAANLATALKNAADPTATVKFAVCTQAEYDLLESYEENVIYIITDDTSGVVYTYANPVLDGTETVLTGITIQGINYAIPQGTEVVANPTLDGNETALTGLQIGNTKYAVGGGSSSTKYMHYITLSVSRSDEGTRVNCFIINDSDTPFTRDTLYAYLRANGNDITANGVCSQSGYSGYILFVYKLRGGDWSTLSFVGQLTSMTSFTALPTYDSTNNYSVSDTGLVITDIIKEL